MQNQYFFYVIFIFLRKKADFRRGFLHGQRSVAEPGPTPSPWSIGSMFSQWQAYIWGGGKPSILLIVLILALTGPNYEDKHYF